MKQKPILILFTLLLFSGIVKAQMDPEDDIVPVPYRAAYVLALDGNYSNWDTASSSIYKFYPGGKHIKSANIYTYSNGNKTLSCIKQYYYNSQFDNLDSITYTYGHGISNTTDHFFRNSLGVADSMHNISRFGGLQERYFYKYLNNDLDTIESFSTYSNGRVAYIRDSKSRVISSKHFTFKPVVGFWQPLTKQSYSYDTSGHVINIQYFDTNTSFGTWDSSQKIVYDNSLPDTISGILSSKQSQVYISLQPNPFYSTISIKNNTFSNNVAVSITDIMGKIIYESKITAVELSNGYTLHLDHFPAGIYLLHCSDGFQNGWSKIIKE